MADRTITKTEAKRRLEQAVRKGYTAKISANTLIVITPKGREETLIK